MVLSTVVCVRHGVAQVLSHSGKNVVADVFGGPLQLAGREDLQQVQVYVGPAKVGGVGQLLTAGAAAYCSRKSGWAI